MTFKQLKQQPQERSMKASCLQMTLNGLLCWSESAQGITKCQEYTKATLENSSNARTDPEQKLSNLRKVNASIDKNSDKFVTSYALNKVTRDRDKSVQQTYASINASNNSTIEDKIEQLSTVFQEVGNHRPDLYIEALSVLLAEKAQSSELKQTDVEHFNSTIKSYIDITQDKEKDAPMIKELQRQQMHGNQTIFHALPQSERMNPANDATMITLYAHMAEGYTQYHDIVPEKEQSPLDIFKSGREREKILTVQQKILEATEAKDASQQHLRDTRAIENIKDTLEQISTKSKLYRGRKGSLAHQEIIQRNVQNMRSGESR